MEPILYLSRWRSTYRFCIAHGVAAFMNGTSESIRYLSKEVQGPRLSHQADRVLTEYVREDLPLHI